MTKHPKDMNAVLEQLSKTICQLAADHDINVAVALSYETADGRLRFSAFGNVDPEEIRVMFEHGARVVRDTAPDRTYEHKADA
jgi:hypothetical protein